MPEIVFVHPDLGIGGAERLIVDAALALKGKNYSVSIFTSHHNPNHCFEETADGTIPVFTYGDWIPRSIFGYCHAIFAYIRMIYVALCLLFNRDIRADVIVCDQVSVAIPILKFKTSKIIFYCHFPDQLLSAQGGFLKALYRAPINFFEELTTKQASKILVNSKFTSGVFSKTFKHIDIVPDVLYPSLPTDKFDKSEILPISKILPVQLDKDSVLFLSLNRFERKKNIALAVKAFDHLQSILDSAQWSRCHLVLAGGYDDILPENVQHFVELENMVWSLCLEKKVTMLKSPKEEVKISLIKNSACLVYTPSNEHFGIVPIEAMYMETAVLGVNSGGPRETIIDGETGFLREPVPEEFAKAMALFVKQPLFTSNLGKAGKKRVIDEFSFENFSTSLDNVVKELLESN